MITNAAGPSAVPPGDRAPLARDAYRPGEVRSLEDEQVAAYVDEGFLVVPGVFSRDEVQAVNGEIPRFARGVYPAFNPYDLPPFPERVDDTQAMQRLLAVHHPHWVNDTIRSAVAHPVLADLLGQLVGAHLPTWDGRVKCMQSMLFVKPPGLPGQAWHQDEHYIPTRDRSLCGAWIALDDATVDNGCLWVIPRSHARGYLYPTRAHTSGEYDGSEEAFDSTDPGFSSFDDDGQLPVEVRAGDVVFFNGYLLHKSLMNRTITSYRRALVNHYCNAWTTLPWRRTGGVASEDYRVVVPVTGPDPYAWKGYGYQPHHVYIRPHRT